jgi:hypothetical protein
VTITNETFSILLIDDDEAMLSALENALKEQVQNERVEIKTWLPRETDSSPYNAFTSLVDERTSLVITDYDLTRQGVTGLFGLTIVGWCKARSLPVGDFSRAVDINIPEEPDLFELRAPGNVNEAAVFAASTYRGFRTLRNMVENQSELVSSTPSLAGVLSKLLERPYLENQLSLYMSRFGLANSSLLMRLREDDGGSSNERDRLMVYVLGHVLLNVILKYPGPILSEAALCAYLSTNVSEIDNVEGLFQVAKYDGPFAGPRRYFWRDDVDQVLSGLAESMQIEEFDPFGEFNRAVVERKLGRELAAHECSRCGGIKGGYLCPFTNRPVCERSDCSVAATNWIPTGAQLCRVERDFYDEWAPLLGL